MGNIFGGFTPVKWDSHNGKQVDPSLKSFLFSLKNPHNLPARLFPLNAERKDRAIYCGSSLSPSFCGMGVSDNCNTNNYSASSLDRSYANNTRLDGDKVLTGSFNFTVKEIEVFEITN
jgi:hypothetical protein